MQKISIMLITVLLLSSCAKGTPVQLSSTEADGFSIEKKSEATISPTIAPEERDFRYMKWGMTLSDITAIEGEGYKTVGEGVICYQGLMVDNFPAESEYTLIDGKLNTCIYYTTHHHQYAGDYIDDYLKVTEKYIKKYGTPLYKEQKWSVDYKTDDPKKFGEALSNGLLMYRTGWEFGNTRVNLVLFKDIDKRIKIGVRYQAIDINSKGDVVPVGDSNI